MRWNSTMKTNQSLKTEDRFSYQVDNVSATKVVFPSNSTVQAVLGRGELSENYESNFLFALSDPNATDGAKNTYRRLSRRMAGWGDRGEAPMLFGQENGTWGTALIRFDRSANSNKTVHDALSCDIHRTTGYYPSALSIDLADVGVTMNASTGWIAANTAPEYFNMIKPKLDRAWSRGECHVSVHWRMPWPLQFGSVNGEVDANVNFTTTNPAITATSDVYHAKWIYQKYTGRTLTNTSPLEFRTGGILSDVATDLFTPSTARNTRWNQMLNYVKDFMGSFQTTYAEKGIELRLLHQSNNTDATTAFWWNLFTDREYSSLFKYSIKYLRDQGVRNAIINYNLCYSPIVNANVNALYIGAPFPSDAIKTYTANHLTDIVALQSNFGSDLWTRYPGTSNCDIISITLDGFNNVNTNTVCFYVGQVQRLVMECQHLRKVPCISSVMWKTTTNDINNTSQYPSNTTFWSTLLNGIFSNKYTSRISHIIVRRNKFGNSHIPIPMITTQLPCSEDFRDFFSTKNPLFGRHIVLQKPKKYTLCTQSLTCSTVFSNHANRDLTVPDQLSNTPIYWPYHWRNANVVLTSLPSTANNDSYSLVFKNGPLGYFAHGVIPNVPCNASTTVIIKEADDLFYNPSSTASGNRFLDM
jgi:hypothetical protein